MKRLATRIISLSIDNAARLTRVRRGLFRVQVLKSTPPPVDPPGFRIEMETSNVLASELIAAGEMFSICGLSFTAPFSLTIHASDGSYYGDVDVFPLEDIQIILDRVRRWHNEQMHRRLHRYEGSCND